MLTDKPLSSQSSNQNLIKSDSPDVKLLQSFLSQKKVSKLLGSVFTDKRVKPIYDSVSLLALILSLFFFRRGSKNHFFTEVNSSKNSISSMAKFIGHNMDSLPAPQTVDNFLEQIPLQEFNEAMCSWFENTRKSKIFFNHEEMLPFGRYQLNFDAVYPYTHKKAHKNKNGDSCPYCLKRESKDKKTGDIIKTHWIHGYLVASFIFTGGMTIPIWVHPIRAEQSGEAHSKKTVSQENLKQECESVAFKEVLKNIRKRFPNLKMDIQTDSLYGNRPNLRFIEKERCGYGIVRKENCLPKALGSKFEELQSLKYYQRNCRHEECIHLPPKNKKRQGSYILKEYQWCNRMDLGDGLSTNLIKFKEITINIDSGKETVYKCEWLESQKISAKNAHKIVDKNRSHWREEDLFNTLENRGFNLRHNYSRDPLIGVKWHMLLFFAFGITEVFQRSDICLKKRGKRSFLAFMKGMFHEIRLMPPAFFTQFKKIQFRYTRILGKSGASPP